MTLRILQNATNSKHNYRLNIKTKDISRQLEYLKLV